MVRIKHVPVNRVHITVTHDKDNLWAELDIAESTWWKVSNGVSRMLVGKAYVSGKRIKSYWTFSSDEISILDNDGRVLISCRLTDYVEVD